MESIFYRDAELFPFLEEMEYYLRVDEEELTPDDYTRIGDAVRTLCDLAETAGLSGNLWHNTIAYWLAASENTYSLSAERRDADTESIRSAASSDFAGIYDLFHLDIDRIAELLELRPRDLFSNYTVTFGRSELPEDASLRITGFAADLAGATDAEQFRTVADAFYRNYGVGDLALYRAFRVVPGKGGTIALGPVRKLSPILLSDLVGYESAKQKLIANTEAFLAGKPANNCLLFGDAGTGKSSCVKGILNRYADRGLRVVELFKHQLADLIPLLEVLQKRNYRFLIFMDDLSFEDFEVEYKYLKAVMEGGLSMRPENVLIYATSNRRHLIREDYADKAGRRHSDMHASDTVEEKLSLAMRFGVTIYFPSPNRTEFETIVTELAERNGIQMEQTELLALANQWELSHGGYTGRCAQQFIDHLLGSA